MTPIDPHHERFAAARAIAAAEAELKTMLQRIHQNSTCPKVRSSHAELRNILAGRPTQGVFQVNLDN